MICCLCWWNVDSLSKLEAGSLVFIIHKILLSEWSGHLEMSDQCNKAFRIDFSSLPIYIYILYIYIYCMSISCIIITRVISGHRFHTIEALQVIWRVTQSCNALNFKIRVILQPLSPTWSASKSELVQASPCWNRTEKSSSFMCLYGIFIFKDSWFCVFTLFFCYSHVKDTS